MQICYISTHYPLVSHTFIQGEILALEARGVGVLRVALNVSDADALDGDRNEAELTYAVKGTSRRQVAAILLRTFVRHPLAFVRGSAHAFASARFDLGTGFKRALQFGEAVLVWHHCERHGVRSIHAHFGQAPATVAWYAARFGNSIGGTERWTWSVTVHGWHEFVSEKTSDIRRKIAAADLVVCISDFTRSQLMRIAAPEDWGKLDVVRCGIDLELFGHREPRSPQAPARIVVVARLSPEKGHLVLIEAVAELRRLGVDVSCRFVGSGPFLDHLVDAAVSLGVADSITFCGALAPRDVARELDAADVFCLPTFAEGLPVSLMEAMAVGIPVATTYISGIPELVIDGETGWVVPPGNHEQLAHAIRDALTSPDRDAIVAAARERVVRLHDRSTNIVELQRLFEKIHDHD